MSEEAKPIAKDPIVLDAEGGILHDPSGSARGAHHAFSGAKVYRFNGKAVLPRILLGAALGGLLLLGLTIAGVALGILFLGWIGRLLFFPSRRGKRGS